MKRLMSSGGAAEPAGPPNTASVRAREAVRALAAREFELRGRTRARRGGLRGALRASSERMWRGKGAAAASEGGCRKGEARAGRPRFRP